MDFGSVLAHGLLGGMVGYSQGALKQIEADTARAREEGLMRLQQQFRMEAADYEDSLATKRMGKEQEFQRSMKGEERDFLAGENEANRALTREEMEATSALKREEMDKNEALKRMEIGRDTGEVALMKFFEKKGLLDEFVGAKYGKDKKDLTAKDKAELRKDSYDQARKAVIGESITTPTDEQLEKIDALAGQIYSQIVGGEEKAPPLPGAQSDMLSSHSRTVPKERPPLTSFFR